MNVYGLIKEILIFLNLLFGAVIMAAVLYYGASAISKLSDLAPAEQQQEACPPGESYSSETGLCYPNN